MKVPLRNEQAATEDIEHRNSVTSVYADHLSALVTVKDNYLSALVGQIESESEMI